MPTYNQGYFGYSGSQCDSMFSDVGGDYKRVFSKIRLDKRMKIKSASMKVGACYGYYQGGSRVSNLHGGFSGRYCIWNSNGTIRCWTDSFTSDAHTGGNQINREDKWASFTGGNNVLEANTDYYFGYAKDWGCQSSVVVFTSYSWINHSQLNSNNGGWGASDIVTWDIEDTFVGVYTNVYGAALFNINVEEVNTGIKLRANNVWNPRHGFRYNGSAWPEQFLKIYQNGWQDVST